MKETLELEALKVGDKVMLHYGFSMHKAKIRKNDVQNKRIIYSVIILWFIPISTECRSYTHYTFKDGWYKL